MNKATQLAGSKVQSVRILEQIESICTRFEQAWKLGDTPAIENFLGRTRDPIRRKLFEELLLTSIELHENDGRAIDGRAMAQRFPEYAKVVQSHLLARDSTRSFVAPVVGGNSTIERAGEDQATIDAQTVDQCAGPLRNAAPPTDLRIPGYDIIRELGRGGMGAVFLAKERKLNRLVALKVLLETTDANSTHHVRLKREAALVARLRHENIVQIHAVGKHKGKSFLVFEYVAGGTLAAAMMERVVDAKEAASLCAAVARAMHFAHEHGVIHRDLKPANILMERKKDSEAMLVSRDNVAVPKITDFGLAKDVSGTASDADRTQTGVLLGTLNYMAPEQVRAKRLGPATDVYALGVILYEMLTGRIPFRGVSTIETIRMISAEEPVAPRQLQANCPRDLETICLKCLAKDPKRRYASAEVLADDLENYLKGRPIQARPVGRIERGWRWIQRNPIIASLIAAVLLVLAAGVAGVAHFAVEANRRARDAVNSAAVAQQRKDEADLAKRNEKAAHLRTGWALYGCKICWAQRELAAKNFPKAFMVLDGCPKEFRNWEFDYLRRLKPGSTIVRSEHASNIKRLAFSTDSRWVVLGDADGGLHLANAADTKTPYVLKTEGQPLAVAANAQHIITASTTGAVRAWSLPTNGNTTPVEVMNARLGTIHAAAVNRNVTRMATVEDDGLVIRRIVLDKSPRLVRERTLNGEFGDAQSIALSTNGDLVAVGNASGELSLWNVTTGVKQWTTTCGGKSLFCVQFDHSGEHIAVGGADHVARLLRTSDGRIIHELKAHGAPVQSIAFSRDDLRLATASDDKMIKIWDLSHGQDLLTLMEPTHAVRAIAFSDNGQLLAAGYGKTVRIWRIGR